MQVFATIVFWWCLGGVCFLPLLMLMETVAAMVRGPEYMIWVQRHMKEHKTKNGPLALTIGWLIVWPFVLLTWMRAGWNRQTFLEWNINRGLAQAEADQTKKTQARKATQALTDALGTHQGRIWMVPVIMGVPFQSYLRAIAVGDDLVCSHLVITIPPEDRIIVLRMGVVMTGKTPEPCTESPDLQVGLDRLDEAVAWCENDHHWNHLCRAGTQEQRKLFARGMG